MSANDWIILLVTHMERRPRLDFKIWLVTLESMQALNLMPASFRLTAGASANASVAGVVNVTNGNVADLYTYVAEVQVDNTYEVGPVFNASRHCQRTCYVLAAQCTGHAHLLGFGDASGFCDKVFHAANSELAREWCFMQGDVMVQFSSPSIPSETGPRVLVQADALTYRKQLGSISVITTASEYL